MVKAFTRPLASLDTQEIDTKCTGVVFIASPIAPPAPAAGGARDSLAH